MRRWSKKGAVEEILEHMPDILLTVIVMVSVFVLVSLLINRNVEVQDIQDDIFVYRLLYSPSSITFEDNNTGRVYPGVIDAKKVTDDALDKTMAYSYERHITARLDLLSFDEQHVATAYYNKIWYNRLEPLARAQLLGLGGAKLYYHVFPVVYKENGVSKPGLLKIRVIMPN